MSWRTNIANVQAVSAAGPGPAVETTPCLCGRAPASPSKIPHPWPPLPPSSDWPLSIVLSAGFIHLDIRAARPLLAACRELCGFIARDEEIAERLTWPVLRSSSSGTAASSSPTPPGGPRPARFGYIVAQEAHHQARRGWPTIRTVVEDALRQVLLSGSLRPSDIAPLWGTSRGWNIVLFTVGCELGW